MSASSGLAHRASRWLRFASWLCTFTWIVAVLWLGSNAGLDLPAVLVLSWGSLLPLGVWVVYCAVSLAAASRGRRLRAFRRVLVQPVLVALCFATTFAGISFKARFLLSRPALEAFVSRSGAEPVSVGARPVRVGLFRVYEAESLPGETTRLITTSCMLDHCGLAFSALGRPPRVGEDSYSPISGGWWRWRRSW